MLWELVWSPESCSCSCWKSKIVNSVVSRGGSRIKSKSYILFSYRISIIFHVRSAKPVRITDMDLLKRLGMICGVFCVFLIIRTLVAPPFVITGRTADDLKAYLCKTDWWDHSFTSSKFCIFFFKSANPEMVLSIEFQVCNETDSKKSLYSRRWQALW